MSLIVKNNNTVDRILQNPENAIVNVDIFVLIKVNNPTTSAITTGSFAIVIALAMCKNDFFFPLLNP